VIPQVRHSGADDSSRNHVGAIPIRSPNLTLRIAAYTAVALLFAAGAILWFVHERATTQAQGEAVQRAQFIADALLRGELTEADFVRPVIGARRRELDDLFQRAVRTEGMLRMNLIAPSGQITYSTSPALIGNRLDEGSKSLEPALAGKGVTHVDRLELDGREVKVLESYMPVQPAGGAPVGVFELYQDYETRVADQARKTLFPVAGFLALALFVLCAALVPILRRVTAAVEIRNEQLVAQAARLEQSLAVAQEARAEAEAARRTLTDQNKRLRELDRLKDEFLSLVSHELRTPLTSIRGYLELVLDEEAGEITPEQRRFLKAVERNSLRLLRLVGDLLFVAQADAGRLTLERAKIDVAALAADGVEAARPVADQKSIQLDLGGGPVPALVADRGRLAQVVDNLVSNALKFTPEGGRVEVRTSADNGHVVLEIEDTGIGIPADEQPRLFERFFRAATATEQAIPGTGLGLAIVKAIVEAHGGRILMESEPNVGTTVRIELPLSVETAAPVEAAA
jgi:signal transduction histidine kinase